MVINIDELLSVSNTTRKDLIEINPAYEKDFEKLNTYYAKYEENPSEIIAQKLDQTIIQYVEKLKKENPEIFDKKEVVEEEYKDDDKQNIKDFITLVEVSDVSGLDDFLGKIETEGNTESLKKLLSYKNYKVFFDATNVQDKVIVSYLLEQSKRIGFALDIITSRNGLVLTNLISMADISIIKTAVDILNEDKELSKSILIKIAALNQALETGNEEIVAVFDNLYDEYEIPKKGKATETLKEEKSIKSVIEAIRNGTMPLDTIMVSDLEVKMQIAIISSAEEIASSKTYQYVVPNEYAEIFDDKVIGKEKDYTRFEAESTDFERRFGATVYEFGFAWYNMLNLTNVNDLIAMMYIANISSDLMVDRQNKQLRADYIENFSALLSFPQNSKISGRFYQINNANIKSLQRSGFLDNDLCPTKLLYCVIVLHAFSFPVYTHPFELINIQSIVGLLHENILKGEYANKTFFTDGETLFYNFADDISKKTQTIMRDVARTISLNITSNSQSDIEKTNSIITRFFPLFLSVPNSQVSIPTFSIKIIDVENRIINWGVYEFAKKDNEKLYVNSLGIGSYLAQEKSNQLDIQVYKGELSHQLFTNPNEGVIIKFDKQAVVARAINKTSFLAENFSLQYEEYYEQMFAKDYLTNEVLDKLEPLFVKYLYSTQSLRINYAYPDLLFNKIKKVDIPYVPALTIKAAPVVDERIYLSKKDSRDLIDGKLISVFDVVMNIRGEQRDEAILDQMTFFNMDTIRPRQLLYLGFDLEKWKASANSIKFKNKYKLRIPNLGSMYYLEKV